MRTVGITGSYGKTTTAWLLRGMLENTFEETGELVGMLGELAWLGWVSWHAGLGELACWVG